MKLNDLCSWALSDAGWGNEIKDVSRSMIVKDFPTIFGNEDYRNLEHIDWHRLTLIASILSQSTDREHLEAALLIAQAGMVISKSQLVIQSSAVVLNQLFNHRTVNDSITKGFLQPDFLSNLGVAARITTFRDEMESKIFSVISDPINANKFQIDFWNSVTDNNWLYASAPTASGKSYIVLKHIIEEIALKKAKTVIYVAPTRALVSEIENNFRNFASNLKLDLSVSSVPIKDLIDETGSCIYVFTQERLHIFLNTLKSDYTIDILVVDEIQKLSDGMRGVILQDAIERVLHSNENAKVIFLSPNSENPEYLMKDKPEGILSKIVDRDQPMVAQNILFASQRGPESFNWKLELKTSNGVISLGDFDLIDRPLTITKKMAMVSFALGGHDRGNMVYSNEPSEAEDIAELIADLMPEVQNEELTALSNLARDGVHKSFKLVATVKKGVAFHYGNMPSLLREEIETLFNKGVIKFLVCTSTLIEGVNLSCKNIFIHGPKKGRQTPMVDQDFWNLAGRAGRWGKEFHGNIICIDPHIWKLQPPQRSKFVLKRQTDEVLKDAGLNNYIQSRNFDVKTVQEDKSYESVLAYLMNLIVKDGGLRSRQIVNNYSTEYIETLEESLRGITEKIDVPQQIIERHSGISAISMQTLLNYFRKDYASGKKPINNLIPLTPETDGAYNNMEGILRRIHLKLYPGFGFGYQYRHFAVLVLNWMQGYTLKRLIQDAISYDKEEAEKRKKKQKNIHAIIRDTMREVEEIARFKAPKYISCYTDILKVFLKEQNKLELYPSDYPFDLFLEFGVMSKTLLSLIGLGLSRMSATELGNIIISTELDRDGCVKWIEQNLDTKDIPEFVKREVHKKILATQK